MMYINVCMMVFWMLANISAFVLSCGVVGGLLEGWDGYNNLPVIARIALASVPVVTVFSIVGWIFVVRTF